MESLGDILRRATQRPTFEGGEDPPANRTEEGDPACPICGGPGWVTLNVGLEDPRFGQAQPCRCMSITFEEERRQRFVKLSNLGSLERFTFDTLEAPDGTPDARRCFEAVVAAAKSYVEELPFWFVLEGAAATGRTLIAAAIANAAMEKGVRASFMTAPDLLDHLRGAFAPNSDLAYDEMFEELKSVPLLVLDDLGIHSATPWAQEKLYQLLNRRYQDRLPTVITLACEMSDLDEHLRVWLMDSNVSQIHRLAGPDLAPALQQFGNLPQEMLDRMTFERFDLRGSPETDAEGGGTLEAAFKFARSYAENPEGWAVFTGVPGSGKTHLAVAIAGERVKAGYPAYFVMAPDLLDHLRQTYSPDSRVSYDRLFELVKNTPLLVLDHLGTHSATPWAQEKLFQLLNRRYQDRLPTVITLACEMSDIDEHLRVRLTDHEVSQVHRLADPDLAPALQQFGSLPQEMLKRMTFERFDLRGGPETDATGRGTLEAAFKFAQSYAESPDGWVVFTGVPGSGKTHLAVAIAGERVKAGYPAYFVMAPDLLDHLRQTYSPDSRVSYDRMFEQVKNAPLLILDDLGMEMGTPWAREKLYQIFAHRYNLRLPLVITTSNEKLDDLPPSIASRLRDGSLVEIQTIAATDYRPKGVGRNRSKQAGSDRRPKRPQP